MATNVDKGLYQAPMGIEQLAQDEEPIEIEIVDPEEVNIHMGDLDISIVPGVDEDEFGQNQFEPVDRICKKCGTGEYLTKWNTMDCPSCGHFRMKHRRSDILWD